MKKTLAKIKVQLLSKSGRLIYFLYISQAPSPTAFFFLAVETKRVIKHWIVELNYFSFLKIQIIQSEGSEFLGMKLIFKLD